ncbi:hypothetical protein LEP1GSC082_1022 [Leptospira kirschneri str. H2]|nr:hypothetical protein LEP1GSC082_1022 [Leptospira kirschneri str. H2]
MFYGDFVSKFFSLDSILFALFDILTLFQGRLRTLVCGNLKNLYEFQILGFCMNSHIFKF